MRQAPAAMGIAMTALARAFSRAARDYACQRRLPVAGNAFAAFFRRDMVAMVRALTAARPERLQVRASTGAPGWAAVPWLAIFAPHVTRSMRRGLYVAVFINPVAETMVLSLQHGAAETLTRLGPDAGLRDLRKAAQATRGALAGHGFSDGPISLGSDAALPQGYQAGSVLSRVWQADAPALATLEDDLSRMLDLYRAIVGGGDAGTFLSPA